ncbi:MAG: phosphotransferase [Fimbriimonadales bacterium]
MKPYLELTVGGQFRRFRAAAIDACRQFDINAVEIKPLNHGENTTFRITDTSGQMHVVRIHRPGYQTLESIDSELIFLEALNKGTSLSVPNPRHTPTGERIVKVSAKGVDGERYAVVFDWIDGKFVGERVTPRHLSMTGELTAKLHRFVDDWNAPQSFERRDWHDEFHLENVGDRLGEFADPKPFFGAYKLMRRQIDSYDSATDYGIIHADLHFGNVIFPNGGIAAIDFDDLGFANYAYDYAVTMNSHRRHKRFEELREAYGAGYETIRKLPNDWHDRLEVFMAARVIFMVDWLFTRDDNPNLRAYRDRALPMWEKDLQRYLDTGSLRDTTTESAA